MSANKESWGTRVGLILAMAGNAVGLGNFLRFPVQAVQNGGGAFIIPYLICFLVMGIPLLWIEWSMGRYGGRFGNHSTPFILDQMTRRRFWKYFGVFGIFTNIAVASYYCYIESWTLAYVFHSLMQTFAGMTQGEVAAFFDRFTTVSSATTGVPYESVVFYIICLLLNTYILSRGLQGGVEKVAKVGVPLLIFFGVLLAIRGFTLGDSGSPEGCTDCNSYLGLNFLWEPQFSSLLDPKVWLAAAGQIFFTLSVGMGTIQCYASYVRSKDDIALNAMAAGWMNGFVEIVLGASIVIPIAVGYLGLEWVQENAGFSMAFQTMPFLFDQWGALLGTLGGFFWFGLLFFAGITSSLAMGTPWMGFMEDEFGWGREKAAWSFGSIVLIMGMPTVYFYNEGVLWEYDYWAGTVALVVFALAESIIFAYIFGMKNGWEEITRGSDIEVSPIFKPLIKYVTPLLLLVVFLSSLVTPMNGDWGRAFSGDWELDPSSILGKIQNKGFEENRDYFADHFEATVPGQVVSVDESGKGKAIAIAQSRSYYIDVATSKTLPVETGNVGNLETFDSLTVVQTYRFDEEDEIIVNQGDEVEKGQMIATGDFTNPIFYIDLAKMLLLALFLFLCAIVYIATGKREKLERKEI